MHDEGRSEPKGACVADISGAGIFSRGDLGVAHMEAHQCLDLGYYELGHQRLGWWLSTHSGSGSQWVHLQWHMLVFELTVGQWEAAFERFVAHVLPAAKSTADALTDAPAALWRLALSAGRPVSLPWTAVRDAALDRLPQTDSAYVALHHLLALAGARDVEALAAWLQADAELQRDQTLLQMGHALLALSCRDYATAVDCFKEALPDLGRLGGSRAQNELFFDIYQMAYTRNQLPDVAPVSNLAPRTAN